MVALEETINNLRGLDESFIAIPSVNSHFFFGHETFAYNVLYSSQSASQTKILHLVSLDQVRILLKSILQSFLRGKANPAKAPVKPGLFILWGKTLHEHTSSTGTQTNVIWTYRTNAHKDLKEESDWQSRHQSYMYNPHFSSLDIFSVYYVNIPCMTGIQFNPWFLSPPL